MEGRVTLDTYREGLADMTNLLVLPQGGVTRRPGTEYLGEIKNSASTARLIPFQFKTTDTYILEFGDQVMRVFRNGLQVIDATDKTITGLNARLSKPIWVGDTITVHGKTTPEGQACWIADKDGYLCAEINVDFA